MKIYLQNIYMTFNGFCKPRRISGNLRHMLHTLLTPLPPRGIIHLISMHDPQRNQPPEVCCLPLPLKMREDKGVATPGSPGI